MADFQFSCAVRPERQRSLIEETPVNAYHSCAICWLFGDPLVLGAVSHQNYLAPKDSLGVIVRFWKVNTTDGYTVVLGNMVENARWSTLTGTQDKKLGVF